MSPSYRADSLKDLFISKLKCNYSLEFLKNLSFDEAPVHNYFLDFVISREIIPEETC